MTKIVLHHKKSGQVLKLLLSDMDTKRFVDRVINGLPGDRVQIMPPGDYMGVVNLTVAKIRLYWSIEIGGHSVCLKGRDDKTHLFKPVEMSMFGRRVDRVGVGTDTGNRRPGSLPGGAVSSVGAV